MVANYRVKVHLDIELEPKARGGERDDQERDGVEISIEKKRPAKRKSTKTSAKRSTSAKSKA
jgi:hypothetical protein